MRGDVTLARQVASHFKFAHYTSRIHKRISLAVTGMIPRSYQVEVMWPVVVSVLRREGRVIYIWLPRQSGKSQELAEVTTQLSIIIPIFFYKQYPHLQNGINVGVYAPAEETAKLFTDKVKDRLESPFYTDFLGVHADVNNSSNIKLSTGSSILTTTASPTAKCKEGPDLDLAIIEEAQAVNEGKIIKSIDPQLAARNGTMVYIFTASHEDKEHGMIYNTCIKEMENREKGLPPDPDFYVIDLQRCFDEPGTQDYRKFVLGRIRRYGIDHPAIQSQYFGNWDATEGDDFMTRKTLLKCKSGEWLDSCDELCVGSLDTAKTNDFSWMTIMRLRDRHIIFMRSWRGDDYVKQSVEIRLQAAKFRLAEFRSEDNPPGNVLNDFLEVETEMSDGTLIPAIETIVRLATSDFIRDESFTQMKLKTQNRGYTYPDSEREEIDLFEKQMCALVRRKVGQKTRVDHQNKRGDQYKSDAPDSLRLVLDAAEGYVEFDEKAEKNDSNSHSIKNESDSKKSSKNRSRLDLEPDDEVEYGLSAKKRW